MENLWPGILRLCELFLIEELSGSKRNHRNLYSAFDHSAVGSIAVHL